MTKRLLERRARAASRLALVVFGLGLGCVGACYSALDPAGDSSSQYADDANTTPGTAFVPLPAQAWEGLNITPHNANTLCVDGVVAGGTAVTLQTCQGSVLQRFKWQEGMLQLAGGRCLDLDISQGVPKAGSAVLLKACDANATTQLWTYGNGWIYPEVVGRTSPPSLCLSTVTGATDTGRSLALTACDGAPAPVGWDLSLYDGNSWVGFAISTSINAGYCIDDLNNATASRSPVVTSACNGGTSQRFSMQDGFLVVNGACLNVDGNVSQNNSVIMMFEIDPGAENELFALEHGRIYTYSGPNVSRCVEIPGGDPTASRQLDIYDCTADSNVTVAPNMHWVFGYDVR